MEGEGSFLNYLQIPSWDLGVPASSPLHYLIAIISLFIGIVVSS